MSARRVAIIVALEREAQALVKEWRAVERFHEGRRLKVFESPVAVLLCGGIGAEAARRAAEAAVAWCNPRLLLSAGFAGALDPELKVGQVIWPRVVIDANDGSRSETSSGEGTLVSFSAVAGAGQKAKLASAYGAQLVDMEAAAVARVARIYGIAFAAVKAISDEASFDLPDMSRFVDQDGKFRALVLAGFTAARPWLWAGLVRLGRNSRKASQALCAELERYLRNAGQTDVAEWLTASRVELN